MRRFPEMVNQIMSRPKTRSRINKGDAEGQLRRRKDIPF